MSDLDLTKAIKSVTDLWDEPLDDVHDLPQIVNAILAAGYSRAVGTDAGEGATVQDTGTAWVTRSTDCPEAPAQAHCADLDLTELREIAEAANQWTEQVFITSGFTKTDLDVRHIAAFDPPTALALIDEIERLQSI